MSEKDKEKKTKEKNGKVIKIGKKRIRITKRTNERPARESAAAGSKKGGEKKKKGKFGSMKLFPKILLILLMVVVIIGISGVGLMVTWMSQAPALDLNKFNFTETSMIYDANGNPYQELQTSEKRIPVDIDDIPEIVQLAFVSIEDQRYYSHNGVDIRGTAKAVINVLLSGSTDGPGGSTITQQLIKQTHLTSKTSIKRKVMEWKLAVQLENKMTKREILEAYLNKVNMSYTWGIESAAELYFGKTAKELSVAQAAVLASIVKSPSFYNPYDYEKDENGEYHLVRTTNEDGTVTIGYDSDNQERALLVIGKMYELGHINEVEYNIAKNELENNLIGLVEPNTGDTYSYFTDAVYNQVLDDLMSTYNYTEDAAVDLMLNGGLKVYATVVPEIQTALEEQAADPNNFPDQSTTAAKASAAVTEATGEETQYIPQVGGAVIENATGYVAGIIGGREKTGSLTMNRALQKFQVGSTTKPITTYSPGIDTGALTLATAFNDVSLNFGSWSPEDADPMQGMLTVRKALTGSVNIVAVQAERTVGHDVCAAYGIKFGFDIITEGEANDVNSAALALGGYTYGQTPLAVTSAYTVFPNGGYRVTPTFYTKVTDSNGVTILEAKQETVQVVTEQTAWLITSVLKNVVKGGTTYRTVPGQEIGGKTGTTDKKAAAWFAGFTPKYTGAFWYGYDQLKVTVDGTDYNLRLGMYGGSSAALYWEKVFRQFYSALDLPDASLPSRPSGIFSAAIDSVSGKAPTELSYLDPRGSQVVTEYFLEGTYPEGVDEMHQLIDVCAETGLLAGDYCPVVQRVFVVKDPTKLYGAGITEVDPTYVPEAEVGALAPTAVCTSHSASSQVNNLIFTTSADSSSASSSANCINSSTVTLYVKAVQSGGSVVAAPGGVSVSSDHTNIANVSVSGNVVTVTGVANGTATLTATYTYNAGSSKAYTVTGSINVTVANASTHAITVSCGENGSISPAGSGGIETATDGTDKAFTMTASSGYVIDSLTVDGASVADAAGQSTYTYTFSNVVQDHSISVSFKTP